MLDESSIHLTNKIAMKMFRPFGSYIKAESYLVFQSLMIIRISFNTLCY